jgi:hypothetical protein
MSELTAQHALPQTGSSQIDALLPTSFSHGNGANIINPHKPHEPLIGPQLPTTRRIKQYTLNVSRALQRKIEACDRKDVVRLQSTGGGLRMFLQVGAYEALRHCLKELYKSYDQAYSVVNNWTSDNRGNVVSELYSIADSAGNKMYTINLYNTTSTVLVNGKHDDRFMTTDLPLIQQYYTSIKVGGENVNLEKLNHSCRLALIAAQASSNNSASKRNSGTLRCTVCESPIKGVKSVECTICLSWYHPCCIDMSQSTTKAVNTKQIANYSCMYCTLGDDKNMSGNNTATDLTLVPN